MRSPLPAYQSPATWQIPGPAPARPGARPLSILAWQEPAPQDPAQHGSNHTTVSRPKFGPNTHLGCDPSYPFAPQPCPLIPLSRKPRPFVTWLHPPPAPPTAHRPPPPHLCQPALELAHLAGALLLELLHLLQLLRPRLQHLILPGHLQQRLHLPGGQGGGVRLDQEPRAHALKRTGLLGCQASSSTGSEGPGRHGSVPSIYAMGDVAASLQGVPGTGTGQAAPSVFPFCSVNPLYTSDTGTHVSQTALPWPMGHSVHSVLSPSIWFLTVLGSSLLESFLVYYVVFYSVYHNCRFLFICGIHALTPVKPTPSTHPRVGKLFLKGPASARLMWLGG